MWREEFGCFCVIVLHLQQQFLQRKIWQIDTVVAGQLQLLPSKHWGMMGREIL